MKRSVFVFETSKKEQTNKLVADQHIFICYRDIRLSLFLHFYIVIEENDGRTATKNQQNQNQKQIIDETQ